MVSDGTIEGPLHEFISSCPVLMVWEDRKSRHRLCVDYSPLNKIMEDIHGATFSVHRSIERLNGKLIATFDYRSAFFQRKVHENTRKLLDFFSKSGRLGLGLGLGLGLQKI